MIGLLVLALLIFYIVLAISLAGFVIRRLGFDGSPVLTGITVVILLVLPFADEIVGRIQFEQACKKVEGYSVTDAIDSAQLAKYGDWPPPMMQIPGWIPITRYTSQVFSVPDGSVILKHDRLSTKGGWVMRSGLYLGNSSSCNNINTAQIMEEKGFELIEGGFFKRVSVGK